MKIGTKKYRKSKKIRKAVYTRKHYQSNDGMLTTVWGPSTWHLLHTMSFNYPVNPTCDDKRNYRDFVLSLRDVLPCGKCRENLCKNFKRLPLTMKNMQSRDTFSKYMYELHEVVNKMLHKKSGLSYRDVKERYEHFRARCTQNEPHDKIKKDNGKEKGCTEPIYGEKAKCILKIVPQDTKCETFQMSERCVKRGGI
jgi:hypothetical protein